MKGMPNHYLRTSMQLIQNFENSTTYRHKIHTIIPGGAHTYSKGDDQFPVLSPAAISYGKGCYVWDIDGNKFLDCCLGLGSVVLGHAYEPVLKRVKKELDRGVNFQRPASIELVMAEKFLSLVPCHQMIKFAKNGSTANTAAVKLARAYTNRKLVAIPSDHPFYSYDDWFIGKTLVNRGVVEEIYNLTVTYNSKDLNTLEALFKAYPNQIACVISEPEIFSGQPENYLCDLISIVHRNGALFIQDEVVTGFKYGFPGAITKNKIMPDLATWGKGIANGFSFCALTGKKEIMELGGINKSGQEKLFLISSTHGGETHAIAACLATIDEFEQKNVIEYNHNISHQILRETKKIISESGMTDYISALSNTWLPVFLFKDRNKQISTGYKTLMLQEMIKRGVLFQGFYVPCFSNTDADVNLFLYAFKESLKVYANALNDGFEKFLVGAPIQPVFRKYV